MNYRIEAFDRSGNGWVRYFDSFDAALTYMRTLDSSHYTADVFGEDDDDGFDGLTDEERDRL